jgi:hypothetical protein
MVTWRSPILRNLILGDGSMKIEQHFGTKNWNMEQTWKDLSDLPS